MRPLVSKTLKCLTAVAQRMGKGFREAPYQQACAVECRLQQLSCSLEVVAPIRYKEEAVGSIRLDMIVNNELIVEFKSIDAVLKAAHAPQLVGYLNQTPYRFGILFNFISHPDKPLFDYLIVERKLSLFHGTSMSGETFLLDAQGCRIQ